MKTWRVCECSACDLIWPTHIWTCLKCGAPTGMPGFDVAVVPDPRENRDGLVGESHGDTSRLAALKVRPKTGTQRARVLAFIEGYSEGFTREELSRCLGMPPNTLRPRVRELIDGGHVVVADHKVRNSDGHFVEVLVAAR